MTRPPKSEVDEAQIVGNHKADHLYAHEWTSGEGRYLNFVIDEAGQPAIDIDLEPHAVGSNRRLPSSATETTSCA